MQSGARRFKDGLFINPTQELSFSFEGSTVTALEGDCIASALLAQDIWMISRSFKYHRPRGILTMNGQDANSLVQIAGEPNCLADIRRVEKDMEVAAQNVFGSLRSDLGRWIGAIARFLPVGFYYKTFHEKRDSWRFWEKVVRRLAGLGKIDPRADFHHSYYDKKYLFADIAIIGSGPAGLSAALAAAESGAEILLIESNRQIGGSFLYERNGPEEKNIMAELIAKATAHKNITILQETICTGWFADHWLSAVSGQRMYKIRAKTTIFATGSLEQPAVFRNNDLPGIIFASAIQRLIRLYGILPGQNVVILTANDRGYEVALDLLDCGARIEAVVDLRADQISHPARAKIKQAGVKIFDHHAILEAHLSPTGDRVAGVVIAPIITEGVVDESQGMFFDCDLLGVSVGVTPLSQLLHQAGVAFTYNPEIHMMAAAKKPDGIFLAGSVNHCYTLSSVLQDGVRAGQQAAHLLGLRADLSSPMVVDESAASLTHPWPIFPHAKGKEFIDFDEDLTYRDLCNAIADGYDHAELMKRYSTIGMGPSQGKHSAILAIRILAREKKDDLTRYGVTTQRPPYVPEKFGHLAGRIFDPERLTAMHSRHLELGAQMMPAGVWWRPAYYGAKEERAKALQEEVLAVRNKVGLIDVSTLGGLDIRGRDAAEFMNRLYTFNYAKQPVGKCRYVLMTDQSGTIIDDGVACRLHDLHYYVTATTTGVDTVYRQMLWWNTQWRLDVDIANVTAAYAAVNLAGPLARSVLQRLCADIDLSPESFPYMAVKTGHVAGIAARVMRVGFVGELGYEIHVPAMMGEALWDSLMEAGAEDGIRPFGVEAQRILRLEKGHIIVSQDTDGLTNIWEADMAWAIGKNKPFSVGQKSTAILAKQDLTRKLVGFTLEKQDDPCPDECLLVVRDGAIAGRVTSAAFSPSLNKVVGLAYVHPKDAQIGKRISIKLADGKEIFGIISPLPFYDPENKRQEM